MVLIHRIRVIKVSKIGSSCLISKCPVYCRKCLKLLSTLQFSNMAYLRKNVLYNHCCFHFLLNSNYNFLVVIIVRLFKFHAKRLCIVKYLFVLFMLKNNYLQIKGEVKKCHVILMLFCVGNSISCQYFKTLFFEQISKSFFCE